ncbi:sterol desaturase family protein [Caldovatus aquaticus]|uniref:Sterol desaturase family protein n=1 Tax=Caldovatus aquaticus TaxID=2865671 RepID=A0ABS7F6I9_9PROT|nr:sterol desaturase family protein [Caldovatus aquaticus]MBW8271099.1 sterol desaturase family protein [Caldovatus aquaticus]
METPPGLVAAEPLIRLAAFAGVLLLCAAGEALAPWRRPRLPRRARWPGNLGLVALDGLLLRVLFPTAAIGAALVAEAQGTGLLRRLGAPGWLAVPAAVVLLDLAIYLQHRVFHAVPALWRLHRVHHADPELDATTGLRFHPIEILLSMAIKIAVVSALGAPAVAVLLFEVLLNAGALFSHANLALPGRLDAALRLVLVTPGMHRVHHSVVPAETDCNFGFCLSWWDRLFCTYRAAPAAGEERMTVGLAVFRDPAELRLDRLLTQPFRGGTVPPRRG